MTRAGQEVRANAGRDGRGNVRLDSVGRRAAAFTVSTVLVATAVALCVPAARAQVSVGGGAVTAIGEAPTSAPPSSGAVTSEVGAPATIPTVPAPGASQPLPTAKLATTKPATTKPATTKPATTKRPTTTRRGARTTARPTTRRGQTTFGAPATATLPPTTAPAVNPSLVLEPLPDGSGSTVPAVGAGDAPTTVVSPDSVPNPASSAPSVPGDSTSVSTTSSSSSTTKPGASTTSTTLPAATPAELRARIESAIAAAGGQPGVLVVIGGQKVADIGAVQERLPASTQKLYVASAALGVLGPNYVFQTSVRASPGSGGVVNTITIVGAGDPTLTTSDVRALAGQVKAAGITAVSGRIQVDDTRYDRVSVAPGWKPSFTPGESGLLSALMIDGNHKGDTAFRIDPALANLKVFQAELVRAGVTVDGAALAHGTAGAGDAVVASRRSSSVASIVETMAKKSNNTYAEMLLKELGAFTGRGGTTAGGTAAVMAHLAQLGVAAPPRMADGSGLSSLNRSSASAQVALLIRTDAASYRSAFRGALPIACVDGTMRSRLCGTRGAGTVLAKTGTIDYVAALTGYGTTASGKTVTFSFLLNGLRSSSAGRVAIDKALVQIVNYTG